LSFIILFSSQLKASVNGGFNTKRPHSYQNPDASG
jgi:hypothetical protein